MNHKILMLIMFFVLSNSAQALGGGSAEGNIIEFNLENGQDNLGNNQDLLVIGIDTSNNYINRSGLSVRGSFSFHDFSGVCTSMPFMRAVLDVSGMSNDPGTKIMYSMLMSAYLLKLPVKLMFLDCMKVFSGADAAKIEQVGIIVSDKK